LPYHDIIDHTLSADVSRGEHFTVPFPTGRVPESYIYYSHKLSLRDSGAVLPYTLDPYETAADNTFFVNQHVVANSIQVTYYGVTKLRAGARVRLELALAENIVQWGPLPAPVAGVATLDLEAAFPHVTEFYCQASNASTTSIKVVNTNRLKKRIMRFYNVTGNSVTLTDGNIDATIRAGIPNRHEAVIVWNNVDWTFHRESMTRQAPGSQRMFGVPASATDLTGITMVNGYWNSTNFHCGGLATTGAAVGGTLTLNLTTANVWRYTLASAITVAISNPQSATGFNECWLRTVQDSTPRAIVWPAEVDWGFRGPPVLSQGAAEHDVFYLWTENGGAKWYGVVLFQDSWATASASSTSIGSPVTSINTVGKYRGKLVWDTDNSKFLIASGPGTTDPWYQLADATGAVTPA
jgi:hypothetical protein